MASQSQALLSKHCPIYSTDHREKIMPISLDKYVVSKQCVSDDTVTACVTDEGDGVKHLHYFLYFASDGGLEVFQMVFDSHQYDLEHMIVEVDASGAVKGVLYQPHGSAEHFWIRGSDLKSILAKGLRPLAFISRGKHGLYPLSGSILRYFGVASDECDKPVRRNYTPLLASASLMKLRHIDGVFPGIQGRITAPTHKKPTVPLKDVRSRLLFAKFW